VSEINLVSQVLRTLGNKRRQLCNRSEIASGLFSDRLLYDLLANDRVDFLDVPTIQVLYGLSPSKRKLVRR